MKKVYSHVMIEMDPEDKKVVDKIVNAINSMVDIWFGIQRLFVHADFKNFEEGWTYTDVKHPQISKTRLLEHLAKTRLKLKVLDGYLVSLQEKVKETK